VADIAAEANVSPRTFFTYFAAKEDAFFVDTDRRLAMIAELLPLDGPSTSPAHALRQGLERILEAAGGDLIRGAGARDDLLAQAPELAAAAMRRLQAAQQALAASLRAAYPRLPAIDAAAMTGAAVGALVAVVLGAVRSGGDDPDGVRAAVVRALDLVEHGIEAVGD
jgi:AcrR family transcriptional regulator